MRAYGTRSEWFKHELDVHRRSWTCGAPECNFLSFEKKRDFRSHLNTCHADFSQLNDDQKKQIITSCEGPLPVNTKQTCPICFKDYRTRHLEKHLGRHMEQLALWVLPRDENEDEGSGTDYDDNSTDTESTQSDGHSPSVDEIANDLLGKIALSVCSSIRGYVTSSSLTT